MIAQSDDEEQMETDSLSSTIEEEVDEDDLQLMKKRPIIVRAPHLNSEEKELINRYSQLFQAMKEGRKDNGEELCVILDQLKDYGTFDEKDCQKAFDAIEHIYNKLSKYLQDFDL